MEQAINAYEKITVTPEFQEMERLRSRARHNEASAIFNAEQREREKWQGVVADQAAELAGKDAELERLRAELAEIKAKG